MELLQRDLQRRLLRELSELYPSAATVARSFADVDERQLVYNLLYLEEHGLVRLKSMQPLSGDVHVALATITASGIDFISDDGGLSAILGVVTVKLHEETIKDLLIKKVELAEADPSTKKRLIDKIKSMPAETLGQLSVKAMEKGVDSLPNAVEWLTKLIG